LDRAFFEADLVLFVRVLAEFLVPALTMAIAQPTALDLVLAIVKDALPGPDAFFELGDVLSFHSQGSH
jgi:hypothetical protein